MTEADVLKISERLCEKGLLRCVGIDDGVPKYELTIAGRLAAATDAARVASSATGDGAQSCDPD